MNNLTATTFTTDQSDTTACDALPPIPRLTPYALLEQLQSGYCPSVDEFLRHFQCSLAELSDALADPDFILRYKVESQLVFLHARMSAQRKVAMALDKTLTTMLHSEKPEVSRRAAASLMQLAGLTLLTRPQSAPVLFPDPLDDSPEDPVTPVVPLPSAPAAPTFVKALGAFCQKVPTAP